MWTFEVWGLGNWYGFNHLYVCASTHQSRRRDACPYMGSQGFPAVRPIPSITRHFFIKAIDKSGEQYKRHVALLKILEPAAKRYTDCPMYGKLCRSDMTVLNTTKWHTLQTRTTVWVYEELYLHQYQYRLLGSDVSPTKEMETVRPFESY